jgi:CoA:oxalate CoA-transferase
MQQRMSATDTVGGQRLPLAGVKVLDFSRLLPGPFATQMLGALGADVVKVEQPGIGDPSRHNHPRYRVDSVYFHAANGNKRSIALDMAIPDGKEVVERLLRWADVAVESFRPGVAAKLGMDCARARSLNPRLVYCSISGFGQSGPLAKIAGHDLAIQALTGLMGCAPDGAAPVPGLQTADFAGALYAVIGIQAALAQRVHTGVGCEVDLAMFEALYHLCFIPLSSALAELAGRAGTPRMEVFGANPRYATYRTKDGRYVAVTLLEAKAWREFCDYIGRPDLVSAAETPADRLGDHGERAPLYRAALTEYCAAHTWDELLEIGRVSGIALCPVARPEDAVRLEHVAEREMLLRADDPREGRIAQLVNPLWRAGLARKHQLPAPALGQDTRAVLRMLGYAADAIDRLRDTGVVEER